MKSYFLIVVSALSLANIDTLVEVALSAALKEDSSQSSYHLMVSKAPVKKGQERG